MKTSNKLFSAAILILLAAMIVYDFQLKAEYVTMKRLGLGQYQKDHRFDNYEKAKFKNFSKINLLAGGVIRVSIEYGAEEAVWIDKGGRNMVAVSQNGETLIVDLSNKGKSENKNTYKGAIVIVTPKIKSIDAKAFIYTEKKGPNTTIFRPLMGDDISIVGLRQDSLQLTLGYSIVHLNKSELKYLNATVGEEVGGGRLSISSDNTIESMKLKVEGKSTVEVLDTDVKKIDHQIAEGAIVTFRGVVIHQLTKND